MSDIFTMIFPGMMLMWVSIIAQTTISDIFLETKKQTLSRMLASNVTLRQIIVSKLLRCFLLSLICEVILIGLTWLLFGVNWKNPFLLAVVLFSFNISLTGLLAVIYGYSKTTDMANAITVFFIMVSSVLGGSFMPFDQLPAILQSIGNLTIIRQGIYGIESIFRSRPLWEVFRPSIYLVLFGGLGVWIGTMILSKRIQSGKTS